MFTSLLSAILAALPKAFIAILAPFVTQKFLQAVIARVVIYLLERLVKLTTNTVDDEILADFKKQLEETGVVEKK